MVIGAIFAGVVSAIAGATVAIVTGLAVEIAVLAYVSAGLIGAMSYVAACLRQRV